MKSMQPIPSAQSMKSIQSIPSAQSTIKINPKPADVGFKETIISSTVQNPTPTINSKNTCPTILTTGKKITNNFFIPSQFPNLTKIRSIKNEKNVITGGKYTGGKYTGGKYTKRKYYKLNTRRKRLYKKIQRKTRKY
jgi:hypothetical protein